MLGAGEAHEAEAAGDASLVAHDLGGGNGAIGCEEVLELLVRDGVGDVLHVQVHALVLAHALGILLVASALELSGSLGLLLRPRHIQRVLGAGLLDDLVVQVGDGLLCALVIHHVHEAKATALARLVLRGHGVRHAAEDGKGLLELGVVPGEGELLDVEVGPGLLGGALALLHEEGYAHLLVVNGSSVELLDGILRGLAGLEVYISVALGDALVVRDDLARQDVAENREGIVQRLVVHRGSQVGNENVASAGLAQRGVTLRPHDTAGSAVDLVEVHGVQSALGILRVLEVHVGITERLLRNGITAQADGDHRTDLGEEVEQTGLKNRMIAGDGLGVRRG
ncbi:hypothetical protein EON65_05660 [archaeon]|nr:MAG: hypothetical protein EON65_05660 [archaeon]